MSDPSAPGSKRRERGGRGTLVALLLAGLLVLPVVALAATRGGGATAPGFAGDVAPIVREKCAGCHRLGGIAPFAFRTASDLQRRKAVVQAVLRAGLMPPWPPGPASPAYVGQEHRTLQGSERETVLDWLAAGARAPAASPVGRPTATAAATRAGETTRRIAMPRAYVPTGSGGSTDDYRCFLIDPKLDRDSFLTSARILPGEAALVHHVILFRVEPGDVAAARRLDDAGAGPGWSCFGGTGIPTTAQGAIASLDDSPWIAAWAPGWGADHLPDGVGVPLAAGTRIVMQVHYNLLNGRRPDRSTAILTTMPGTAGLQRLETTLLPAPVELPCAPGESAALCDRGASIADGLRKYGAAGYVPLGLLYLCGKDVQKPPAGSTTTCDRPVTRASTIHGVAGHMHLLGRSIRVELNPGTPGARVLLDIPDWSFHWQTVYTLKEPVRAAPGDVVRVTCTFDTGKRRTLQPASARAPKYVVWGEGTTDEMCLGILEVTRG